MLSAATRGQRCPAWSQTLPNETPRFLLHQNKLQSCFMYFRAQNGPDVESEWFWESRNRFRFSTNCFLTAASGNTTTKDGEINWKRVFDWTFFVFFWSGRWVSLMETLSNSQRSLEFTQSEGGRQLEIYREKMKALLCMCWQRWLWTLCQFLFHTNRLRNYARAINQDEKPSFCPFTATDKSIGIKMFYFFKEIVTV